MTMKNSSLLLVAALCAACSTEGAEPADASAPQRAAQLPPDAASRKAGDFSMKVADVFKVPGRGVVLTGRVESGSVRIGESICLRGEKVGARELSVHGIQVSGKAGDSAQIGDMAGILVTGIEAPDVVAGADSLTSNCR
jgi:translation elongation factor EF-Tu-like GTPase